MKASQKAMIYKDINEVVKSSQTLVPMIVVPLILTLILPLVFVIAAKYGVSTINGMDYMMKIFRGRFSNLNNSQLLIELGLNYLFPVFFLLIPVMASSIIAASSFVGEKERKTMESLLYTPMSIRELFVAKVLGAAVPAYVITLISFLAFGIVMNIGGEMYFDRLIFPNLKWILLIIWVTPAVTLLGVNFMVLVSAKANTFQEAQQMSIFIILPILLLLFGQLTGLFMLSEIFLVIFGAVIYLADFIIMKNAAKGFRAEKLI